MNLRIQRPLLDAIDGFAAKEPDTPSRTEAIRRLVELGLTVKPKRKLADAWIGDAADRAETGGRTVLVRAKRR